MSNDIDDQLSPAAVSLIRNVISAQKSEVAAQPDSVDATSLVRYLRGALPYNSARDLERVMVRSRVNRQALIEARNIMDRLQQADWAYVESNAAGRQFEGEVARAWMDLEAERVANARQGWQKWVSEGWLHILEQSRMGAADAQAVWAEFLSFGERFKVGMSTPRFALARGGENYSDQILGSLENGLKLKITNAELTLAGDLVVSANISTSEAGNLEINNQLIRISLSLNGEIWPLTNSVVRDGHVQWTIPEIRSLLSLPVGKISGSLLSFTIPDANSSDQEGDHLPFRLPGDGRNV